MNFREYLHKKVTSVDIKNEEEVTLLISWLSSELIDRETLIKLMEDKIKDYLTANEYKKFSQELADEMFDDWVDNMPDGEFKEFAKRNADIVKDPNFSLFEAADKVLERENKEKE